MKCLIVGALMCVAVVSAVKPRFNAKFSRQFQRLETAPSSVPHTIYGPPPPQETPSQQYGPPQQEYGPPTTTTEATANNTETTTEIPTTTESFSESVNKTNGTSGRLTKGQRNGLYYIYHPNGQLQKVVYSTKKDPKTMAFSAQLKYENVEPITAPIYTYDPKTLVLTRFQQ